MKIVINKCYGGFSLSHKAIMEYAKLKGFELYPYYEKTQTMEGRDLAPYDSKRTKEPRLIFYYTKPIENLEDDKSWDENYYSDRDVERNDETLIEVVEKLGNDANGSCAELEIIEIPNGVEWEIEEYDGIEWVAEKHRTWS